MQRRLYNYLEKYNLLYGKQFGFRKRHCTTDALAELTKILRMGSKVTHNISVFLDLKKVFETPDHSILLEKLEAHGVRGTAKKWCECLLSNIMQFVEVNSQASDWANITTVPQGSVLGSLCSRFTTMTLLKQFSSRRYICMQTLPTLQVFVRPPQVFKTFSLVYATGSFPMSYLYVIRSRV